VANELKTRYPAGATLYAHVVRADGQVWNGSAFEAPAAANWATYAVTVTEQSTTGYYYGTMPAVAAGLYDVFFLLRAGGSPATTDALVGQAGLNWNGSADSAAVADASGRVDVTQAAADKAWASAARTLTAFGFTVATNANATETAVKATTDRLAGLLEHPTTYDRFTAAALEQAPGRGRRRGGRLDRPRAAADTPGAGRRRGRRRHHGRG
jgi:hypothetical protein